MYGCFGWFAFRAPDFPAPFAVDFSGASHVFTDADGRRFADETGYEVHDRLRALLTYLPRNPNRPRLPSWVIFAFAALGALTAAIAFPWHATEKARARSVPSGYVQTLSSVPSGSSCTPDGSPNTMTGLRPAPCGAQPGAPSVTKRTMAPCMSAASAPGGAGPAASATPGSPRASKKNGTSRQWKARPVSGPDGGAQRKS